MPGSSPARGFIKAVANHPGGRAGCQAGLRWSSVAQEADMAVGNSVNRTFLQVSARGFPKPQQCSFHSGFRTEWDSQELVPPNLFLVQPVAKPGTLKNFNFVLWTPDDVGFGPFRLLDQLKARLRTHYTQCCR